MARQDVELVIRAKNEASKALAAITGALNDLTAAQANTAAGAQNTNGLVGDLARQFKALDTELKGLGAFSKVAKEVDSAGKAVERLEKSLASAAAEQAKLNAAQSGATSEAARLREIATASAAALKAEQARLTFLRGRVAKDSPAFVDQTAAVAAAKQTNTEAQNAARLAETNQTRLANAVTEATAAVQREQAALAGARVEFQQVTSLAGAAGAALGGVAANQDAVSAASKRTAADLQAVGAALERQAAAGKVSSGSVGTGPAAQATAAFRAQVQAVTAAKESFAAAQAEATRLGRELATTTAPTNQLKTAFLLAKEASDAARASYDNQALALANLRGKSTGGFAAVDGLAKSLAQVPKQESAVQRLLRTIGLGQRTVDGSNRTAGRKGEVLFGLRPYELQNLSFQINDLFTQIASGTSVSQAVSQQIGQIVQIFPRLGAVLIPILPELIGLAAALATVVSAMKNVGDQAESVREFGGQLAASADGSRHSATALATSAHALDVYGTSLKVAREEIAAFVSAGVDDTQIERFGRTAENASKVLGLTIPDAAKKMAEAFTRGYDAVKALDDSFNFLSLSERQHIEDQFKSGHAAEARTEAFRLFEARMDEGARKERGPWSEAVKSLTNAWDHFLTFLADTTAISGAIALLGQLAHAAEVAASKLPGATNVPAGSSSGSTAIDREIAKLDELKKRRADLAKNPALTAVVSTVSAAANASPFGALLPKAPTLANFDAAIAKSQAKLKALQAEVKATATGDSEAAKKAGDSVLKDLQDQYDSLKGINDQQRIRIAGEKALAEAQAKGATAADQQKARLLGEQIERVKVDKENAAKARSAESRANALQNKLDSLEGQLLSAETGLGRRVAEGQVESLSLRLGAIDAEAAKIKKTLDDFRKRGGTDVNGQSLPAFEAQVNANAQTLKNQATLVFYTEQIADLEKQRDDRLKSIADRYAEGKLTAAEAFAQERDATTALNAQIADLAKGAELFASSLAGAKVDPKIVAFIERMERIRQAPTTGTNTPAAKGGKDLLSAQDRALNDVVSERNALIQTQNELLDQGVIGYDTWRARVSAAYTSTTPEIEKQVTAIRTLLDLLREQGAITETAYASWLAKLELVGAQTTNLTTQILSVRDAEELLGSAGVSATERFLQRVAEGKNVFSSLARSALEATADILRSLGELILKQQLLNLLRNTGAGKALAGAVNTAVDTAPQLAAAAATSAAGATITAGATLLVSAAAPLGIAGATMTTAGATWAALIPGLLASAAALQAAAIAMTVANATGAGIFHSGGIAGSASRTRSVHPGIFAGAFRYHSGGFAGLKPGEVPAILQRNEEILTKEDPRHAFNGGKNRGGASNAAPSLRQVLVLDPAEIAGAMAGPAGEQVMFTFIKSNAPTLKQILK